MVIGQAFGFNDGHAITPARDSAAMKFLSERFGRGPKAIQDLATSIFGSKASVAMTDVVGPKDSVYLAGVPVDQMMFWVPHPGKELGVGISILSYRGKASLAVIADADLVPDPESDHGRVQPRVRANAACHYADAKATKTSAASALSPKTRTFVFTSDRRVATHC